MLDTLKRDLPLQLMVLAIFVVADVFLFIKTPMAREAHKTICAKTDYKLCLEEPKPVIPRPYFNAK